MFYRFLKRLADIFIALGVLILGSPLLLLMTVLIKLESKGPALFKQDRIGKDGRVFKILKFRSMVVGAEQQEGGVYSGKNDVRVTRIGRFIRATSIDELPQFINVLVGEMSLIGPRPPLTYHPWTFDKYTDEQRKMFNVRPGLTGWAQINGRKDVEWHRRIELNVWYVEHLSFWLDFKIFWRTVFKVFLMSDNVNRGETLKK